MPRTEGMYQKDLSCRKGLIQVIQLIPEVRLGGRGEYQFPSFLSAVVRRLTVVSAFPAVIVTQ